jgi:hypothetical protein
MQSGLLQYYKDEELKADDIDGSNLDRTSERKSKQRVSQKKNKSSHTSKWPAAADHAQR